MVNSGLPPEKLAQIMYGDRAKHIPCWMYAQDMGDTGILFVGASRDRSLLYESGKSHTYILGEMIVRPHMAVASNEFRGHGAAGLARAEHANFVTASDRIIICDHMSKIPEIDRKYG